MCCQAAEEDDNQPNDKIEKLFVISCHICNMIFAIQAVLLNTIPYSSLFVWLTDFTQIYAIVLIATESFVLLTHCLSFVKCFVKIDCLCAKCIDLMILAALFVALVAQTVLFSIAMTRVNVISERMEDDLYDAITELYGLPDYVSITETINKLQRNEGCCGVYDYDDYYNSTYANLPNNGGRVVPLTCYRIPEEGINAGPEIDESKIYDKGCLEELIEVYDRYFERIWNYIISSLLNAADLARVFYRLCNKNKVGPESVLVRKAKSEVKEAHFVQVGPESWDWVRKAKSNDQEAQHFVQVGPESSKLVRKANSNVKEADFVQVGPKPSVWVRKAKSNDQEAQHFVQVGPISLVWERKATLNDQEAHIVQVGPISSDG